ncbi:hypothetical protein [uncultured Microbulbifer sp.]|uniref:hypothetical protein n=1 Tax=uncultured Microbulbifer sp. TaxID=348147 RepID=UPI0026077553|nr:hypothetical protein [uncultured Microbulbifer sp.]
MKKYIWQYFIFLFILVIPALVIALSVDGFALPFKSLSEVEEKFPMLTAEEQRVMAKALTRQVLDSYGDFFVTDLGYWLFVILCFGSPAAVVYYKNHSLSKDIVNP